MSDHHLEIIAHYEVYEEANRLIKDNPLEFLRTAEIIKRSLNPPPGVIVDIGGGPGVYAAWLARPRLPGPPLRSGAAPRGSSPAGVGTRET